MHTPLATLSLPDDPAALGARDVVARLRAAGHDALVAGGAVRDLLLGRTPKDYDVATDAEPHEVAALFPRAIPVGAQFGISRILVGGHEYEVARFRAEGPREDALRRDFTVNGLFLDPLTGEVRDYVGGLADLDARRLRACGHDPAGRFFEDPLRVLRAARFAASFDLAIDPATRAAMAQYAEAALSASPERQRDELVRMLTGGAASRAFGLLEDAGVLAGLLPEVPDRPRLRERLVHLPACAEAVAWTVVGLDWAAPAEEATALAQRLRLPTRLGRHVGAAVGLARTLPNYRTSPVAARKRWIRDDAAPTALAAASIATTCDQVDPADLAAAEADRAAWTPTDLRAPALVSGRDLAGLGLAPGPRYRQLLEAVEDAWLEGRVATREEALALATRLAETGPAEFQGS